MDACGDYNMIQVPIIYGSMDRVVAALETGNTQNRLPPIPMMSCYMTGIDQNPDRRHGVNQVDRRTYLEQGGVYPQDVKILERVMAIPYDMRLDLSIVTSNTDQMYQILEQILMLFDPSMQIQFNDAPFDWTRETQVTLETIGNEENYPAGAEKRMITYTLGFIMPVWLSPPMNVRNNIIQSIRIQLGDVNGMNITEIGPDGTLQPFTDPYADYTVTAPTTITPTEIDSINISIVADPIDTAGDNDDEEI